MIFHHSAFYYFIEKQPHAIAPVNEVSNSLKKQLRDGIQPLKERKDQVELNCTKANYELDKVRCRVTTVEAEIKTEIKKLVSSLLLIRILAKLRSGITSVSLSVSSSVFLWS